MAFVFRFSFPRKVKAVYFPALLPYLMTSVRTALGMSFKSGVAAEVIGVPSHSIGEQLYMAKIYLDTAGLFSWTLVIIAVTFLIENLFLFFLGSLGKKNHAGTGCRRTKKENMQN